MRKFVLCFLMGTNITLNLPKLQEEIIFWYLVNKKSDILNDPSALFICYYIIIIFSIWFGHPEPQTSPFHGVKNINSNNSSYCCKSCPKNPIFLKKLLKKKFRKKIFHQKKSKNQIWSIFDFSLIGSSVFELEPKMQNWESR